MGARGEGTIQAGDQEIGVIFDNRALCAVARDLDKPIFQIMGIKVSDIGKQDLDPTEFINQIRPDYLTALLREGMDSFRRQSRSASRPVTLLQADAVMNEIGLLAAIGFVLPLAMAAFGGNDAKPNQPGEGQQDADDPNA